jgi:hypothetical protein
MKNDIEKDNPLLPHCRQDTKKGKELRAKTSRHLLIVLHLLVIVDLQLILLLLLLLLISIIIIVIINSSRANTEGSQLSRSQ